MIQASEKKGQAITVFYSYPSGVPNAKASASSVTRLVHQYDTTIAKIADAISSLSRRIIEKMAFTTL